MALKNDTFGPPCCGDKSRASRGFGTTPPFGLPPAFTTTMGPPPRPGEGECLYAIGSDGAKFIVWEVLSASIVREAHCLKLMDGVNVTQADISGGVEWNECEWGGSYAGEVTSDYILLPDDGKCGRSYINEMGNNDCIDVLYASSNDEGNMPISPDYLIPSSFCSDGDSGWEHLTAPADTCMWGQFDTPSQNLMFSQSCVLEKKREQCPCKWGMSNFFTIVDTKGSGADDVGLGKDVGTTGGTDKHGDTIPKGAKKKMTIGPATACEDGCTGGWSGCDDDDCDPCCEIIKCVGKQCVEDVISKFAAMAGALVPDSCIETALSTILGSGGKITQALTKCKCP